MAFDFLAGCIGGCAGVIVGHPLDTVKVRLQAQDFRNPIYKGAWHCFKTILKNESVKGLFKGVTSPLGGVALINAVVFGTYGNVQRYHNGGSPSSHFLAGATAGLLQSFICSPMEMAKIRLQMEKGKNKGGSLDCLIKIWKENGIRGVFKGLTITAIREPPAYGVYFFTYEVLTGGKDVSTFMMMFSGGIAGMASWIFVYPIDVIKTRLQTDGMNGKNQYKNAIHCLTYSIKQEGYGFLTRGLFSTCVRAFPVNAVTFTVVTWLMRSPKYISTFNEQYKNQQKQKQFKFVKQHNFRERFTSSIHLFEDGVLLS